MPRCIFFASPSAYPSTPGPASFPSHRLFDRFTGSRPRSRTSQSFSVKLPVMRHALALALLIPFHVAVAQSVSRPEVPEKLAAPASERVVLQLHATGSQNYVCRAGADQKFTWVFEAPEAELFDSRSKVIGKHYAGPTWQHSDGSEVVGKVVARQDAPEPDAIPWLLLTAASHTGNGILTGVTTIQRIRTHGGQPPAGGCDDSHNGSKTKSQYSADYYFYGPVH